MTSTVLEKRDSWFACICVRRARRHSRLCAFNSCSLSDRSGLRWWHIDCGSGRSHTGCCCCSWRAAWKRCWHWGCCGILRCRCIRLLILWLLLLILWLLLIRRCSIRRLHATVRHLVLRRTHLRIATIHASRPLKPSSKACADSCTKTHAAPHILGNGALNGAGNCTSCATARCERGKHFAR